MARQPIPSAGAWATIANLLNVNFADVYQSPSFGIYDYEDLITKTTAIQIPTADTWVKLTNDGAGPNTNKTFALPNVAELWDVALNQFDFSGLVVGDAVDLRIDLAFTTTGSNQDFDVDLVLGVGSPSEFRLPVVIEKSFKAAGTHRVVQFTNFHIGSADILNNPAELEIRSSGQGSAVVNGWYLRPTKRVAEVV